MHDARTRETAGIKCRGKEERRKARMDARGIDAKNRSRNSRAQDTKDGYSATEMPNTGHRGQMSAEPMSGSNPDAIDEEKGGMASRGMEEFLSFMQTLVAKTEKN